MEGPTPMKNAVITGIGIVALASTASADVVGVTQRNYTRTVTEFDGGTASLFVTDLFLVSNDARDVVLNVFNLELVTNGPSEFYQSLTGPGWTPNNAGGIFDTSSTREADSFVTIGGFDATGLQTPGAGEGTNLDPNFGGNGADAPGSLAGWFNSNPPNLNGLVQPLEEWDIGLGVLIGRFSSRDPVEIAGTSLSVTWNQGIGTPGSQGSFTIFVPAPGAFALMGIAGLTNRRRRS